MSDRNRQCQRDARRLAAATGLSYQQALAQIRAAPERSRLSLGAAYRSIESAMVGGPRTGDLLLLSGSPGSGKTAWALNALAEHLHASGEAGLFISLEIRPQQLAERYAITTGRPLPSGLRFAEPSGRVSPADVSWIAECVDAAIADAAVTGQRLRLVCLDNLGMMAGDHRSDPATARQLKQLAASRNVLLVCLLLAPKVETRQTTRWGAGSLLEEADHVIGLSRQASPADERQLCIELVRTRRSEPPRVTVPAPLMSP